MSAGVVHKNLYDLLGNDIEDENDTPVLPSKEVVKQVVTSKKRDDPPPQASESTNGGRGGYSRRGRGEGNDAAFHDRGAGRYNNRAKTTDEDSAPRGDRPFRARGGRGGGGRGGRDHDRHSASARTDTDKQVSQGWGSTKGTSEWDDEKAGESIAQADATDEPFVPVVEEETGATTEAGEPVVVAAVEPEPEDITKSYAEYLAERAKANPVAELPEARAPNEGAREDKKWAAAKELKKEEGEEYFASSKSKKIAAKTRKEKTVIEIDPRFTEPRDRGRGDRGRGGRGGRGGDRGGDRGGRGRGGGEFRGERRPYGGPRGGANGTAVNIEDSSAFPSLGQ